MLTLLFLPIFSVLQEIAAYLYSIVTVCSDSDHARALPHIGPWIPQATQRRSFYGHDEDI